MPRIHDVHNNPIDRMYRGIPTDVSTLLSLSFPLAEPTLWRPAIFLLMVSVSFLRESLRNFRRRVRRPAPGVENKDRDGGMQFAIRPSQMHTTAKEDERECYQNVPSIYALVLSSSSLRMNTSTCNGMCNTRTSEAS